MTHLPLRTAIADLHAAATPDDVVTAARAARLAVQPHLVDGVANAAAIAAAFLEEILQGDCADVPAAVIELAGHLDEVATSTGEYTEAEREERELDALRMLDQYVRDLGGSDDPDGDPWQPRRPR